MSTSYVSAKLRATVAGRARRVCEYCLIHENHTFAGCEIDHIVSEKHGGQTVESNLAYACYFCNRGKGSDVATILREGGQLVRLFNPRTDRWSDHFRVEADGITFAGVTEIGRGTVDLLRLNAAERLIERRILYAKGLFPTTEARERITDAPSGGDSASR